MNGASPPPLGEALLSVCIRTFFPQKLFYSSGSDFFSHFPQSRSGDNLLRIIKRDARTIFYSIGIPECWAYLLDKHPPVECELGGPLPEHHSGLSVPGICVSCAEDTAFMCANSPHQRRGDHILLTASGVLRIWGFQIC